jgi:hypothetical protein
MSMQVRLLPEDRVESKVYGVDSHRLALYLDSQQRLLPLIRAAILEQMGFPVPTYRLHNLV